MMIIRVKIVFLSLPNYTDKRLNYKHSGDNYTCQLDCRRKFLAGDIFSNKFDLPVFLDRATCQRV